MVLFYHSFIVSIKRGIGQNQASLEFYTPVGEMDISHTLSKMENHLVIVSTAAEKKKVS